MGRGDWGGVGGMNCGRRGKEPGGRESKGDILERDFLGQK